VNESVGLSHMFFMSDSNTDEFLLLKKSTGEEIIIKHDYAGYYRRCVATAESFSLLCWLL
jgi:hypothetical protein